MMLKIDKEMLEKFKKREIAVAVNEPELWDVLMDLLTKEGGFFWGHGETPPNWLTYWYEHRENTVVASLHGYLKFGSSSKTGLRVVEFTDFIKEEGGFNIAMKGTMTINRWFNANPYEVTSIQYNNPYTTVIFKDRSVVVVKCSKDSEYDEYLGFCAAITKKVFGSNAEIKRVIEQKSKDTKKKHHDKAK